MARYFDDVRHYYDVLDLEPGASKADVERAYREMAQIWHPDRFREDARLHKRTEQKMKEINRAREEILAYLQQPRARRTNRGDGSVTEPEPCRQSIGLRLPPHLLKYAIPLLVLLLSLLSRVPVAIALALLLFVAVVLFFPVRKG